MDRIGRVLRIRKREGARCCCQCGKTCDVWGLENEPKEGEGLGAVSGCCGAAVELNGELWGSYLWDGVDVFVRKYMSLVRREEPWTKGKIKGEEKSRRLSAGIKELKRVNPNAKSREVLGLKY